MIKFNITEICGVYYSFSVNLVRRFRVLKEVPKSWEEVMMCTTSHGIYESGLTTIYQSKTTKKYYMVRYFDGCFSQMYAEVNGIDWRKIKSEMGAFWNSTNAMHKDMWHSCRNGEMTYAEKNIRVERLRNRAKEILIKLFA